MKGVVVLIGALLIGRADGTARADESPPAVPAVPAHAELLGLEAGSDARETLRLNAFGIVSQEISGRLWDTKWWRPVRGKFRYATTYQDFFVKVGRPDLAEQDHQRRVLSGTLYWGGIALSVGGGAVLVSGLASHADTRKLVGLALIGGGLTSAIIGSAIQPPMVSEEDAERMASEYNRRLEVHLGVVPTAANGARQLPPLGMTVSGRW